MKKILLTFGVALALFATTQVSAQDCSGNRYKQAIFSEVDSVMNIEYGENFKQDGVTNEKLFMDIYFPKGDADNNRAVILLAHGGSFIGGDKADVAAMCRAMSKMGYVTVTINYRLINPQDPAILLNLGPGFKKGVVRAIHDMKAAIRFIRNSATTNNPYGLNPDLIISGGVSAGAIMANHVTYMDAMNKVPTDLVDYITDQGGLEGTSGTPGVSSVPQMSLSMCGAILDTVWLEAGAQPFYGVHTEEDQTVKYLYGEPNIGLPIPVSLYGDSLIFKRAEAVGINSRYLHYPNGIHCAFLQDPAQLQETMTDMMDFTYHNLCETGLLNTNKIADKLYFSAYPNPTSSDLTIEIPSNQWDATLEMMDLLGKTVFTTSIPASQTIYNVNVSTMPAGVYQVRVRTNDGRMANQKIVIQ